MRHYYLGPERPNRIIGPSKSNGQAAAPLGGQALWRPRGRQTRRYHRDDQVGEEELNKNPGPG